MRSVSVSRGGWCRRLSVLGGCCVVVLMEGGIARRCVDWRRNLGGVGVAGGYW